MATHIGSWEQLINVDEQQEPLLHRMDGKDAGAGASNRIVLHSAEPIEKFVAYLTTYEPTFRLVNMYPGSRIYLSYGSYLKAVGGETKQASALNPIDMGWAQNTISPELAVPNKSGKTKIKAFNLFMKGSTAVLSPPSAAAMAIEKVVLKRDYYVMISGRQDIIGLKGEVTRIVLHEWSPDSKDDQVTLTFKDIGDALKEHEEEVEELNESAVQAFLRKIKEHSDHHHHHEFFHGLFHHK
ncbi:hypothetical protein ACFWU3_06150 [Streptomyces sp. NPDC058685]|uniref:hypothetical protein n=1 Tax=Streptomyces sp. NPDC058685 TaxID=3346598 RepID=UPI003648E719